MRRFAFAAFLSSLFGDADWAKAQLATPGAAASGVDPVVEVQPGAGLTADEVARRAVQNSHALAAKRHSLKAANAQVDQAAAAFWPQLLLQARYTRFSGVSNAGVDVGGAFILTQTPAPAPRPVAAGEQLFATNLVFPVVLDQYSLQAGLSIPLSDYLLRTSHAIGAATSSREAAHYDARATQLSVAREGRVAYYEWVRALGRRRVAAQAVQLASSRWQDAQSALSVGHASNADVLRAEASVAQAQLGNERARQAAVLAELRMRVLMNDTGSNEPYQLGEDLFTDLPAVSIPAAEAGYREAAANRPELRALYESEAALRAQASLAASGNYPRLVAQGNVAYANPNQRSFPQEDRWQPIWDAGLVLSWRPTDIPAARAGSEVSRALALEVKAQRLALENLLRVEVSSALEAVKEARFALITTETGLRAAEEGFRVRRDLFRDGRSTLLELTDAETELTRARVESIDARVNSRVALVVLNHVLGRDTLHR